MVYISTLRSVIADNKSSCASCQEIDLYPVCSPIRSLIRRACIGSGAHPDLVDDAGLLFEDLRRLEQDIAGGLVGDAKAGVEGADDGGTHGGALGGRQRDIGIDPRTDLVGEPVADQDRVRRAVER